GGVIRILMLGSPPEMDSGAVAARIRAVEGVSSAHHIHLWQMDEHQAALEAHIVLTDAAAGRATEVRAAIKARLRDEFGIGHSTLELETGDYACAETQVFGHR